MARSLKSSARFCNLGSTILVKMDPNRVRSFPVEMLCVVGFRKPYYWDPFYDTLNRRQLNFFFDVHNEVMRANLFRNNSLPPTDANSLTRITEAFIVVFHQMVDHARDAVSSIEMEMGDFGQEGAEDDAVFLALLAGIDYTFGEAKSLFEDSVEAHLDIDKSILPDECCYGTFEGLCGKLAPMMDREVYFGVLCCIDKLLEKLYNLKMCMERIELDFSDNEAIVRLKAALFHDVSTLAVWVAKTTRAVLALCFEVGQDAEINWNARNRRADSDSESMEDMDRGVQSEDEVETT